jgi:hypothetical protein
VQFLYLGVRCGLMGIGPWEPPSVLSHPSGTIAGGIAVGLKPGISAMCSSPPAALIAAAALACAVPGRDWPVPGRAITGAVSGRLWSYCAPCVPPQHTPPTPRQPHVSSPGLLRAVNR